MSTEFKMALRQALLMIVDALEREPDVLPQVQVRTSELRKWWKEQRKGQPERS